MLLKGGDMKRTSRRTVLLKGGDMKRTSRRTVLLKDGDMKRTLRRTLQLKGGDMKRTLRETALLKGRNTRTIQLPLKHLKGVGIGKTPLSRLAKCAAERTRYRRGHRTTTTTQRYVMACCINIKKLCTHIYVVKKKKNRFSAHTHKAAYPVHRYYLT